MENRAYALVTGLFVTALVVAGILIAIWMNRDSVIRTPYTLVAQGNVSGLNPQAQVRYRGLLVGKVNSIYFDSKDPRTILVDVSVSTDTPITTATYAELALQGVTGLSYVQLLEDERKPGQPFAQAPTTERRIPLRPSILDRLSASGERIALSTEQSLARLNTLLSDENQRQMMATVGAFEKTAARLGQITDVVKPAADTLARTLPPLAVEARASLGRLNNTFTSTDTMLNGVTDLTKDLRNRTQTLEEMMRAVTKNVDRVGSSADELANAARVMQTETLPRVNSLTESFGSNSRTVNRTVESIGDDPSSIIFGYGSRKPGPGEPGFIAPAK